ncbi:MAG: ECF-type sigma factor [Phycisphaerales bacterium]
MTANPLRTDDLTTFLVASDAAPAATVAPVFDAVYDELRQIAARAFTGERAGHTLQPTALVHEVWLKLQEQLGSVSERDHVIALGVVAMRRILTDHARASRAQKRGGDGLRLTLHETAIGNAIGSIDPIDLADALDRLASEHGRAARVFELHVLGALPQAAVAQLLGISEVTVRRDWAFAKIWMQHEFAGTRE